MSELQRMIDVAPPALLFERLLPKYVRRFNAPPPIEGADVEQANRLMRNALASSIPYRPCEFTGERPV